MDSHPGEQQEAPAYRGWVKVDEDALFKYYKEEMGIDEEDAFYDPETGLLYNLDGVPISSSRYPWMSLSDLGFKAVTAAISDLYARGGTPKLVMASIGVPEPGQALDLVKGVREAAISYDAKFIGGDTNKCPRGCDGWVDIFVAGIPLRTQPPGRSGSRVGDYLVQVGVAGLGSAALHVYKGEGDVSRYPRIMRWSRRPLLPGWYPQVASHECVHASIDNSDGVYRSLYLLAKASGVGIHVDQIIFDEEALEIASFDDLASLGGEDYNLFLSVGEECLELFLEDCLGIGGECWVVGRIVEGSGLYVGNRHVSAGGWRWF